MKLPKTIAFVITSRCNLRCKMCFQYGETAKKMKIKGNALLKHYHELNFSEIKRIINKINKYYPQNNRPEFFITGGEPFIRQDMIKIIEYLSENDNKVVVNTNFSLVNRNMITQLVRIVNFLPLVSIDGTEQIHDQIRGVNGTYAKAIRNLKFFSSKNKLSLICTTITKYNIDHLIEIYKSFKDLNIILFLKHVAWMPKKYIDVQKEMSKKYFGVEFKVFFPESVSVTKEKIKLLEEKIKTISKLKNKIDVNYAESARPDGRTVYEHHCTFSLKQENKICTSPELTILPNGDISFCNGGAYGLGPIISNILRDELPTILKKKQPLEKIYNQLLKKGILFPVCVKCSYLNNKHNFLEKIKNFNLNIFK